MPLNMKIDHAELRNVNLGSEGSGDGMLTRLDLKFQFNATSEILASLLNEEGDGKDIFWRDGNIIEGLGDISITTEWSHNDLTFGVLESLFDEDSEFIVKAHNVTVKNAVIKPMANHLLEVSLTAQVRSPDEHQLKTISDFQRKEGGLVIEFDPNVASEEDSDDSQEDLV